MIEYLANLLSEPQLSEIMQTPSMQNLIERLIDKNVKQYRIVFEHTLE